MKTLNKRKKKNTLQANKHKYVLGERLVLNNKLILQVGGGLIEPTYDTKKGKEKKALAITNSYKSLQK